MKRILYLALLLTTVLCCFTGCNTEAEYNHESFYGVVRFWEDGDRLVVYIPRFGDVEIPENDGCCSCFDGHEPNVDYSYQLKEGDLIKINFKYAQAWDETGVTVMETYPARFDKKAGHIEVLRESISFEKADSQYTFSFPTTSEIDNADIGDNLYFVYHEGKNGFDSMKLYAIGTITDKTDGIISVSLEIHGEEATFLDYYPRMSVELTWEN